jgi:hypothetical protein
MNEDLIHLDSQIRELKKFKLEKIAKKLRIITLRELEYTDKVLREEREVGQDEFLVSMQLMDIPREYWIATLLSRETEIVNNNLRCKN